METVFRIIFFTLFIALLAIRGYFGWKARQAGHCSWFADEQAAEREGWLSMILRPIIFLGLLVLIVVYALDGAESSWLTVSLPNWVRWLGVGLGVVSIPLMVWVHDTLREFWSTTLQIQDEHKLVTEGPYHWVRHPMYTTLLMLFVGLSLISAVWPFLVLAVIMVPFFNRIAGKEETMMIEQFCDAYRSYMQRTGRFLPRFR
ncbi:MAG: isoprenylcysteine carboxylmethyltransferase family protein [Anaerolineales bacterium]|jgi:protein-S-isoprenylcysteine O-methyltransferase Ste14